MSGSAIRRQLKIERPAAFTMQRGEPPYPVKQRCGYADDRFVSQLTLLKLAHHAAWLDDFFIGTPP